MKQEDSDAVKVPDWIRLVLKYAEDSGADEAPGA
jgi:hypothetical protein